MKTIVYIAHPDFESSSSQQFLYQSGLELKDVTFVNLEEEYQLAQCFDASKEQERLMDYQRIIFQFPLYWYQAPAVLKYWIDQVLSESLSGSVFYGKELGLVVTAGVKSSHYQAGGREGHSLSALLSPYQAMARYFNMTYLAPFVIYQFAYFDETEQFELFWKYRHYLSTGKVDDFTSFQNYLLESSKQLTQNDLELDVIQEVVWQTFLEETQEQADELASLNQLMEDW